jgi:hypothetical protein
MRPLNLVVRCTDMAISDSLLRVALFFLPILYAIFGGIRVVLMMRTDQRARFQSEETNRYRDESRQRTAESSARTAELQGRSEQLLARSEQNQDRWEKALTRAEALIERLERQRAPN